MFLKPYPPYECPTGDGRNFILLDYLYYVSPNGDKFRCIPHSRTDGGTIPQELWSFQAPFGVEWLSFILHDCLYQGNIEKCIGNNSWIRIQMSFDEGNEMLLQALLADGVSKTRAYIIYYAVKAFGENDFSEDLEKPITK